MRHAKPKRNIKPLTIRKRKRNNKRKTQGRKKAKLTLESPSSYTQGVKIDDIDPAFCQYEGLYYKKPKLKLLKRKIQLKKRKIPYSKPNYRHKRKYDKLTKSYSRKARTCITDISIDSFYEIFKYIRVLPDWVLIRLTCKTFNIAINTLIKQRKYKSLRFDFYINPSATQNQPRKEVSTHQSNLIEQSKYGDNMDRYIKENALNELDKEHLLKVLRITKSKTNASTQYWLFSILFKYLHRGLDTVVFPESHIAYTSILFVRSRKVILVSKYHSKLHHGDVRYHIPDSYKITCIAKLCSRVKKGHSYTRLTIMNRSNTPSYKDTSVPLKKIKGSYVTPIYLIDLSDGFDETLKQIPDIINQFGWDVYHSYISECVLTKAILTSSSNKNTKNITNKKYLRVKTLIDKRYIVSINSNNHDMLVVLGILGKNKSRASNNLFKLLVDTGVLSTIPDPANLSIQEFTPSKYAYIIKNRKRAQLQILYRYGTASVFQRLMLKFMSSSLSNIAPQRENTYNEKTTVRDLFHAFINNLELRDIESYIGVNLRPTSNATPYETVNLLNWRQKYDFKKMENPTEVGKKDNIPTNSRLLPTDTNTDIRDPGEESSDYDSDYESGSSDYLESETESDSESFF